MLPEIELLDVGSRKLGILLTIDRLVLNGRFIESVLFTQDLCNQVNVTIPNFIGCSATTTPAVVQQAASATPGATVQGASQGTTTAHYATPITISSTAAAVTYDGGPLLTGTCTNTQFASATLVGGTILQYPLQGCANSNPGCCPFGGAPPGPLNACPGDYFTTSGACCPKFAIRSLRDLWMSVNSRCRGWSVYPSALYGTQTPCFTVPRVPLVAPTGLSARAEPILPRAAATSVITTQLFSLRYPLAQQDKSLSTGAIVGIAAGAAAGVILLGVAVFFFIRRYRAIRQKQLQEKSSPFGDTRFLGPDHYDRRVSVISAAPGGYYPQGEPFPNELPDTATHPPLIEHDIWYPQAQAPISPMVQQTGRAQLPAYTAPNELPGDENIHAHHPAFGASTADPQQSEPQSNDEVPTRIANGA